MKTKETYFLDPSYVSKTTCIKDGFWTAGRIAKEPCNGSRPVMEWIADVKGFNKEPRPDTEICSLLDIGCGPASKIPEFFSQCSITGIDLPEAVALARKNNPGGIFYACDLDSDAEIASVSRKIGLFDLILCIDVIEHVLYPEKMLRLIKKHLKPETGEAYISTLERDISRGYESGKTSCPHAAHVREWNEDEFTRFLTSEGFIVHECKLTPLSTSPTAREAPMKVQTLRCTLHKNI